MDKQFKIYSVDTKSFYNEEEEKINKQITGVNIAINLIKEYVLTTMVEPKIGKKGKELKAYTFEDVADLHKQKKSNKYIKQYINQLKKENKELMKSEKFKDRLREYKFYKDYVEHEKEEEKKNKNKKNKMDILNSKLNDLLKSNTLVRELNPKKVSKYNLISLFDSDLSRTLELKEDEVSTDLLIVRVYHYPVLEQLIEKGYNHLGEHYIALTASAGQIRTKKVLFIKESSWGKIQNIIMCGLTIKDINSQGGCNINKFLAYLALCTSASAKIEGFNIDKAIVIDDFETTLKNRKVDYINNKTFEVGEGKEMDITITHSDGCGWVLYSESKKSFQMRMPWFKGLMTPVNYLLWCEEYNNSNYKVKDIWGKEWDLKADDIKYVFSKSQFKMWKYYKDWQDYKDNFIEYDCNANYCNMEEDYKDFRQAKFTYQMWQTLLDIKEEEIEYFTEPINKFVTKAYTDKDVMLKILGVTKENIKKDYLQQALEIYPELLKDSYIKDQLGSAISKIKKDSKSGKVKIDAKNTFLIPDVFAWMQFVFYGEGKVTGLLNDGEVSCKLFKKEKELLVERSPHLYKEEAVRVNIINKDTNKWFLSNGIYTSCHDMISKILQFDNDGDHALVAAGKLVEIAKRNAKDVLPLYYDMGNAEPKEINSKNIYDGLVTGFKYSNIGQFSNKLTALWNKDIITKNDINTAKVITALNNYCIDAAKTLEMKTLQKGSAIDKAVKEINKLPMPYFFKFTKDKDNVSKINNSTVNRICKKIEEIKQGDFDFSKVGNFRSANLMNNAKIEINPLVIEEYDRLNKEMQKYFFKNESMEKEEIACAVWDIMKFEFDTFCKENNIKYGDAVDMIIKNIYRNNKDSKKKLLFNVFGDMIVENLKNNIKKPLENGYITCSCCGKRTKKTSNRQTMCKVCREKKIKERDRNRKKIA